MDRRSWLWRRRSSDKNSGEPENSGSGSGSSSSPPEKLSDEQQANSNQNTQPSDITTKSALQDEDANDSVKILAEKLSSALATISAKEELVKQHSKVAEEAVAGWEKAENEVIALKQQLDLATKKNSSLEDKVAQLDGALKECLRQLRQLKDEHDLQMNKSELEAQLADLRAQLETSNAKSEAAASLESDLRLRLGILEKENVSLQMELQSRLHELKVRTLERDLSTKTAETASKHNLDSIKRVAKLEAECRRLKTMLRKATSFHDQKSIFSGSPSHVGSVTDSQSDYGERSSDIWSPAHLPEINLMDDFLEMERLAALPTARESRSCSIVSSVTSATDKHTVDSEASLKAELETMINSTVELEEKIEMLEAEKGAFQISQAQLRDANMKMGMLQAELDLANELKQAIEMELEDANVRREEAESRIRDVESESELLVSRVAYLEGEVEKERCLCSEVSAKCRALEEELSRTKREADDAHQSKVRSLVAKVGSLESELEKERRVSEEFATKCKELEDELSRVKREVESWKCQLSLANESKEGVEKELQKCRLSLAKVGSLEEEVDKERKLSAEFAAKCRELEEKLSETKQDAGFRFAPLMKEELNVQQEKELAVAANKLAECQKTIASLGTQLKSLAMLDHLFLDPEIPAKDSQLLLQDGAVEITSG